MVTTTLLLINRDIKGWDKLGAFSFFVDRGYILCLGIEFVGSIDYYVRMNYIFICKYLYIYNILIEWLKEVLSWYDWYIYHKTSRILYMLSMVYGWKWEVYCNCLILAKFERYLVVLLMQVVCIYVHMARRRGIQRIDALIFW